MKIATVTIPAGCAVEVGSGCVFATDSIDVKGTLGGVGSVAVKSKSFYASGAVYGSLSFAWSDEAITVGECVDSPQKTYGSNPKIVRKYRVLGTWNENSAYMELMSYLGNNFIVDGGRPKDDGLYLTEVESKRMDNVAAFEYDVTFSELEYQEPETVEVEEYDYNYSTVGETARITHSIQTISATTIDGSEPQDFDGGIGINDEGAFEGVDVTVRHAQFTIDISLPRSFYTRPYRILIAQLTGAVNSAPFDGFAAGEVLFTGITSLKPVWFNNPYRNNEKDYYWRATYSFSVSENTYLNFGGEEVLKLGWDYAWRVIEKRENSTTKKVDYRVTQLNVERVYPWFDFNALCIPTPL